ncbi:MAG: ATP-binding cassette domain-containing protein [Proteobacteria bacterium]|nr:ATP-binding cassette domain-containing protein [Pseudomonadota bacterium]
MASQERHMIHIEHLTYHYGDFCALKDISFDISSGQIVAFIGPNGAGKSTTMKILTTLLRPETGNVTVAGIDVSKNPLEVRRHIGYLPETNPLYEDMIVHDALEMAAAQHGIPRAKRPLAVKKAAQHCSLNAVMHLPIHQLSRGFRQRVGIAQAIIHDPDILILDEATTGLDPNQIREIRDLILSIGKTKTILLSTHILQEVTAIASRIILIDHGTIACDGTVDTLLNDLRKQTNNALANIEDLFAFYTSPRSESTRSERSERPEAPCPDQTHSDPQTKD